MSKFGRVGIGRLVDEVAAMQAATPAGAAPPSAASVRRAAGRLRSSSDVPVAVDPSLAARPFVPETRPAVAALRSYGDGVSAVTRQQLGELLQRVEREGIESLSPYERRLLETVPTAVLDDPAPVARGAQSSAGPAVITPADGQTLRPFQEVADTGELVAEDGVRMRRMAGAPGDDPFFLRENGEIVDFEGRVIGTTQLDEAAIADFDAPASAQDMAMESSALSLSSPQVLVGKVADPRQEQRIAELAQRIRQATMDPEVARFESRANPRFLAAEVSRLTPEEMEMLLRQSELSRYVSPQASDAVRAEALAMAQDRLARLEQMAEQTRRNPAALVRQRIDANRSANAPAAAAAPAEAVSQLDMAGAMRRGMEAALPDGDWDALISQFDALPVEQRLAAYNSLPDDVREFVRPMMSVVEDAPPARRYADGEAVPRPVLREVAFDRNAVGRVLEPPIVALDDLAIARMEADGVDWASEPASAALANAEQERAAAFSALRNAVIASDPAYASTLERGRQVASERRPAAIRGTMSPIDAGRPANLPERALPTAADEARAAQREFEERRAAQPTTLPPEMRGELGAEFWGVDEPRDIPLAGASNAAGRMETRSRQQRFVEGTPEKMDTARIERAQEIEGAVAAAQSELDAARTALLEKMEAEGIAGSLDDLQARAPQEFAAFTEAREKLRAAYATLDKSYGNKGPSESPQSMKAKETRAGNRIRQLNSEINRLQEELVKAQVGDDIGRVEEIQNRLAKLQETRDNVSLPESKMERRPPAARAPTDNALLRASPQRNLERAIEQAAGGAMERVGYGLARPSLASGGDAFVDWAPDADVESLLRDASRSARRGRLGGGFARSRQMSALRYLFSNRSGEFINPLQGRFASADEAADFLLSRHPDYRDKVGEPGYDAVRQVLANGIEETSMSPAGAFGPSQPLSTEAALRNRFENTWSDSLDVADPELATDLESAYETWRDSLRPEQVDQIVSAENAEELARFAQQRDDAVAAWEAQQQGQRAAIASQPPPPAGAEMRVDADALAARAAGEGAEPAAEAPRVDADGAEAIEAGESAAEAAADARAEIEAAEAAAAPEDAALEASATDLGPTPDEAAGAAPEAPKPRRGKRGKGAKDSPADATAEPSSASAEAAEATAAGEAAEAAAATDASAPAGKGKGKGTGKGKGKGKADAGDAGGAEPPKDGGPPDGTPPKDGPDGDAPKPADGKDKKKGGLITRGRLLGGVAGGAVGVGLYSMGRRGSEQQAADARRAAEGDVFSRVANQLAGGGGGAAAATAETLPEQDISDEERRLSDVLDRISSRRRGPSPTFGLPGSYQPFSR